MLLETRAHLTTWSIGRTSSRDSLRRDPCSAITQQERVSVSSASRCQQSVARWWYRDTPRVLHAHSQAQSRTSRPASLAWTSSRFARRSRAITPRGPRTPPSFPLRFMTSHLSATLTRLCALPACTHHIRTSATHQKRRPYRCTTPRLAAPSRLQASTRTNQARTRTRSPCRPRPRPTSYPRTTTPACPGSRAAPRSRAR
ncbi:hypothetical protein EDB92DRAFT_703158 [Lactarius akahatsu]|uniref:Uncharacterized protein n=1 Tax=Lactarius akahatsu TaxID=416441 RepID=A0AAD4LGQ2_9AGAM|nr:hypothetical protein EDB92DRAFT_703158 [Lactarius akahatsu]